VVSLFDTSYLQVCHLVLSITLYRLKFLSVRAEYQIIYWECGFFTSLSKFYLTAEIDNVEPNYATIRVRVLHLSLRFFDNLHCVRAINW
jgi:hypothetical protein